MLWPRELPRLIAALPGWDDPAHCDDRVLIGNWLRRRATGARATLTSVVLGDADCHGVAIDGDDFDDVHVGVGSDDSDALALKLPRTRRWVEY